jgi:DHA1 family tetracycline resistance protein-like MFS transporter
MSLSPRSPASCSNTAPSQGSPGVSLLPVFLIVLVDVFGMTLVIPLLAIYAESFGASPLQATLLISVFALCQLVSGPLLGHASDRLGRKPMLILSQIGTFIGFIVLARATSLWMVFVSRIIDGATAGNLSLAQAYISDHTPPEARAKAFGLIGIAFGLGFFIGPSVTGYLAEAYGLNAPIYLAAGMSATSVLATIALLGSDRPTATTLDRGAGLRISTYVQYFSRPRIGGLLLQFFVYILSFSVFVSGFALFAERRFTWDGLPFGPREIGFAFSYVGLLGILLQGVLIHRLVSRFGETRIALAGFTSLVVGYLVLGLSTTIGALAVAGTIASFGNGVLRPALTSVISRLAGAHEQGVVLGVTQSMASLASIVAPPAAGWLIGYGQLTIWAWLAAGMALAGSLLAWSTPGPDSQRAAA